MTTKMVNKILTILISVLLLSISAVSAFTAESGGDVSICAGTTSTIVDTVTGEGQYSITSSGSASDFSTTIPSGLIASDKGSVYSYISPPSSALPGPYQLVVRIEKSGELQEIEHKIKVIDCHASELSVDSDKSSCTCEESAFLLTLKNSGDYLESYNLFAEGTAKDWITFSDSIIVIGPGEEKSIKAYAKAPCNVYGKYELTFKSKASTSASIASAKANIDIKPCYEFSIDAPESYYSICENSQLSIPVTISNTGTADNKYGIILKAPYWATIDKNMASILSQQTASANIIASPPYQATGNFSIITEATSSLGEVKKTLETRINVEKCYNAFVDIDKQSDRLCNAVSNKYDVRIKNTGKFANTYNLELGGANWASLGEPRITLDADGEKIISLDIHPPYNADARTYKITVTATDALSKAFASDSIDVDVATLEQCYQPAINAKQPSVELSKDNTATDLIIIENKGTENATYIIDLSGTASKFSELNPGVISIAPGKSEVVYLYIAPTLLVSAGSYEAIVTARMKDTTVLSSKTISIEVSENLEEKEQPVIEENATQKQEFFTKISQGFARIGHSISNAAASINTFFSNIISSLKPKPFIVSTNLSINEIKDKFVAGEISEKQLKDSLVNLNMSPESADLMIGKWKDEIIENATSSGIILNIENLTNVSEQAAEEIVEEQPAEEIAAEQNMTEELPEEEISAEQSIAEEIANETLENETGVEIIIENMTNPAEELKAPNITLDFTKYKHYVVGAMIIIIIMLLFITGFWKKIIEFFEEEVEEPKNNKKK